MKSRMFYGAFHWREGDEVDMVVQSQECYTFLLEYIKDLGYHPLHSEVKMDKKTNYGEWQVYAEPID